MSHVDDGTLHALVDNALDTAERAAVEAHLATCGDCARRLAEATAMARQVVTLLGALDEVPTRVRVVPPVVAPTVHATPDISPLRRRVFTLHRVAIAASLLMVAGVSYEVGTRRDTRATSAPMASATSAALKAAPRAATPSVVEADSFVQLPASPLRQRPRSGPRNESDFAAAYRSDAVGAKAAAPVQPVAPKALSMPLPSVAVADVARDSVSQRPTRMAQRQAEMQSVVVTGAGSARAPASPSVAFEASAVARNSAPKLVTLPGYMAMEEDSIPAITRRRYVSSSGTALMLLIVRTTADARKRAAVADSAPQFTVTALHGRSIVRWHARGMDYELQGALAPDSLVKLATQLK